MRDHQRREAPLVQLREERRGSRRILATPRRQRAHIGVGIAVGQRADLRDQPRQLCVDAETERSQLCDGFERTAATRARCGPLRQRGDRSQRNGVVALAEQDHIAVSEVRLRRRALLRPLPAGERDQIGIGGIARARIASAHALEALAPALRRERLGVVVQREEVELRAVACEVAGVGRGVRARAAEHGQ